jgi:hypothetical protein
MPKPFYKPPTQLVKEWPEVFEDLYMNTVPLTYLSSIELEFVSGMVWQIDIEEQIKLGSPATVADILSETIKNSQADIERVSYLFDTKRFKRDIKKLTESIL